MSVIRPSSISLFSAGVMRWGDRRHALGASYENLVRQPLIISEPELEVDGWDEAEAALAAAQQMPGGPERIAALKKAEQLRFRAEERQGAILKSSLY
jgi:hypothetical protein